MRFIANFCLVVRDTWSRYTHTHTNSHMPCRLCSSSHAATQLWPIFRRNWHDDCCYSCCCYSDNSNSCCYGHISVKVVWPKDVGISMTTIRLQQMWIIADVHFLFPNRRPMRSMIFRICRIYSLCASWSVTRNNFRRRHKTAKATTKRCDYDIYKIICFVLHKWQKQYAQRTDSKTAPVKVRLPVSAGEDYSDSNNNNSSTDNNKRQQVQQQEQLVKQAAVKGSRL